jgi:putative ABC transport system ATP-binding protein
LLVTHQPDIAAFCRRMVQFQDGRLVQDEMVPEHRRAEASRETLEASA